ncbi:hypothetical protein RUM43_000098 [Polyplax serrata]|uniref:G-protein coupled receptors family 2 profile 2 domain-containing protein n=1 Tax=Polyplax serrata TaxID=468196 RepID=A0AAN8SG60_POLSC
MSNDLWFYLIFWQNLFIHWLSKNTRSDYLLLIPIESKNLLQMKLYCPRNTLHLHLFVSFIMRAFVTFLKEFLFEQGVGLKSDFVVRNGTKYFVEEINDNWECKGLTTVWQYFIMANYSWILMEGLYIHNLLMFALFSDNGSIIMYVALGWGLPLVFVVAWALVRINLENDLCWTTNSISQNFLIIRVPIIIAVLI